MTKIIADLRAQNPKMNTLCYINLNNVLIQVTVIQKTVTQIMTQVPIEVPVNKTYFISRSKSDSENSDTAIATDKKKNKNRRRKW